MGTVTVATPRCQLVLPDHDEQVNAELLFGSNAPFTASIIVFVPWGVERYDFDRQLISEGLRDGYSGCVDAGAVLVISDQKWQWISFFLRCERGYGEWLNVKVNRNDVQRFLDNVELMVPTGAEMDRGGAVELEDFLASIRPGQELS